MILLILRVMILMVIIILIKGADDGCNYNGGLNNWAIDWQNSHRKGIDWYECSSAHSEPLNANRKAYAAWWLWARLAGWEGSEDPFSSTEKPAPWVKTEMYEAAILLMNEVSL